ncbi:hypothetical protein OQZ33_00075 [Pedobacter sp. MC2016-05]|uniref:hypothetical protein n=1 Tax=Pedobacter sp. MC2016-05 TaxID=2994474 RepID=UPI0022451AF5|nr:hypothetical protein [Pedobacter sp. MC2016-05]MCX2472715.1 hypothetical protein [Pedobacter sp. MC2016-05]
MKNILISIFVMLLLSSCSSCVDTKSQNRYLTYQNIVILSDMSSRLDNKPSKDISEIHKIVQFFKNECVKPGEKIGDKSSISFSQFSEPAAISIDLDKIKTIGKKQQFINSTGKYKNNGLVKQIELFENKTREIYLNKRNKGLDLISLLSEKIDNESIVKENKQLMNGIDTTFVNYENHIFIFTDGYLEYLNKDANSQFYFGNHEIDKVRKSCVANRTIANVLESYNALCLPINKSPKNQFINLHILETHERDKNDKLNTYKHPKGQRDNEILEAVWRKWALESGFKSFEWKKY